MATKPVTTPQIWAGNGVWITGPFPGSPTKADPGAGIAADGHRAGSNFPTAAEHENFQQNQISTWVKTWLFFGTSVATQSASIVERDSTGRPFLHGLTVANTLDETGLVVTGVSTTTPTARFTATTGTTIVAADPGNSAGTCYAAETKAGAATGFVAFMTGSPAGAIGMRVVSSGGQPLLIENTGLGRSVRVEHSGATTEATLINSTSSTARGMRITVMSGAEALFAESGLVAGNAIRAFLRNTVGFALYATTPGGSTVNARAVRAQAQGAARGLEVTADAGDGASFVSSGVGGAAIYCPGRATDPTNTFNGRRDFNTTTKTWVSSDQDGSEYRDDWSSRGGLVIGEGSGPDLVTNNNTALYVVARTLTLTGANAPHRPGSRIVLRFVCEARGVVFATTTMDVLIRDVTANLDLAERHDLGGGPTAGFLLSAVTTSWQRSCVWELPYTVPVAGDRTFTVAVKPATANGVQIRDIVFTTYGSIKAP